MRVRSELALWVHEQVFLGTDRRCGYTLDQATGDACEVEVDGRSDWYVRHNDEQIDDAFLERLCREVHEQRFKGLSVASCRSITDQGARVLGTLDHCEVLDLFDSGLGDAVLADVGQLAGLRTLNLAGLRVTDEGLRELRSLRSLEKLHLGWTDVTDAGLAALASLPNLRVLELRSTAIGDDGVRALARMPQLRSLGLQDTRISDRGVSAIGSLAGLEDLYLGYTAVTDACVASLTQLRQLRCLMVRATGISRNRDAELRGALPRLEQRGVNAELGTQLGLVR